MDETILKIIDKAYKETMPGKNLTPNEMFLGAGSSMESIELVSFILLVEEMINDAHKVNISLMDEKAFSSKNSPFKDVPSLITFIKERLS